MPANILSIMQTNKNRQSTVCVSVWLCICLSLSVLSVPLSVAAAASAYTINSWKHAASWEKGAYDNHITHTTRQPHKHSLVKCSTHTHTHAYFYCLCVCVASTAPKSFSILQAICIFSTIVSKRPHAEHYPHIHIDKTADDKRLRHGKGYQLPQQHIIRDILYISYIFLAFVCIKMP